MREREGLPEAAQAAGPRRWLGGSRARLTGPGGVAVVRGMLRTTAVVGALALAACGGHAAAGASERGANATTNGPASSLAPVANAASWAAERRELVLRRAREHPPARVVLLGDSITQGLTEDGAAAWARHLQPLDALELGCTGDRTEHLSWRLQNAPISRLQPEHVVVLIGTNNLGHGTATPAATAAGVCAVVALVRTQCPVATVHLHELLPRAAHGAPLRGAVLQVNQALRAFVRAEHERDPAAANRLRLHAFGDAFVQPDGSLDAAAMPDGLHLSAAGYEQWAAALAAALST